MKLRLIAVAALSGIAMASFAHAEWGKGLGNEYKTILIPYNQQSGWGVQTESAPAPKAAAPAPKVVKVEKVVPEGNWILQGVKFETASDKLLPESQSALNEAAEILTEHPRVVVEIQGHTDNVGSPDANNSLSLKRAVSVQQYLIGKGVKETRLQTKGYGETAPAADNSTEEGRAQNRRIQFKVISR